MVFSGLVMACRLAICPTSLSPVLLTATTEGMRRLPSALVMTTGSPPSSTATSLNDSAMLGRPGPGQGRGANHTRHHADRPGRDNVFLIVIADGDTFLRF